MQLLSTLSVLATITVSVTSSAAGYPGPPACYPTQHNSSYVKHFYCSDNNVEKTLKIESDYPEVKNYDRLHCIYTKEGFISPVKRQYPELSLECIYNKDKLCSHTQVGTGNAGTCAKKASVIWCI